VLAGARLAGDAGGAGVVSGSWVEAIVVRASRPSSARAGDRARVLPDGTIEGFVGGSCSESTVRMHALRCLETGEPVLVKIVPGASDAPASDDGSVTVENPCLSGGSLEIFLQPHVPAPTVSVVGDTPIAASLRDLVPAAGFALSDEPEFGVVVASHDHGDEDALRAAIETGVPYVALVSSRRRGAAILESLGVEDGRVRTPAGLDIGARTPGEIAISILAQMIAEHRRPTSNPIPLSPTDTQLGSPAEGVTEHHCCGD
jgi:xanthine dehydrogenase accessory factor